MGGRFALLIGTGSVRDGSLPQLATAGADVRELAALLRDPYIAGFDPVIELVDASTQQVGREIAHILDRRQRDDLVLLYYSGHALFDDEGQLHLAMPDTELDLLSPTSISAAFVSAEMDRSRSRRQLLILDCRIATGLALGTNTLPSGITGHGRNGETPTSDTQRLADAFHSDGRGRVIFAGCDGTRDSAPGFRLSEAHELLSLVNHANSPFTHALVEGLRGAADADRDGRITIDELYHFASNQLGQRTPWLLPSRRGESSNAVPIAYAQRRVSSPASASRSTRPPKLGGLISDRYRTLAILEEGGLGTLYAARDEPSGRPVSLRCLRPPLSVDATALERFLREAQVASAIDHPSVVRIFELGFEGRTAFIVMEPLDGESLGTLLRRKSRLELSEALEILLPALEAVSAAHAKRVVHGDLNPDSIFINRDENGAVASVKVLGFGLSAMLDAAASGKSEHGLLGSPQYMAPEQLIEKRRLDRRSDVYAFGVILYEVLTGKRPFDADNHGATLFKIGEGAAERVTVLRPDVPAALESIVRKAMAKERGDRYSSVERLRGVLKAAARAHGWIAAHEASPRRAEKPAPIAPLPRDPKIETPAVFERPFQTRRTQRSRAWMLGVAMLATAAAAAAWALSDSIVSEPLSPTPMQTATQPAPQTPAAAAVATPPVPVPPLEPVAPPPANVEQPAANAPASGTADVLYPPNVLRLPPEDADLTSPAAIRAARREARRARAAARAEARKALARTPDEADDGSPVKVTPMPETPASDDPQPSAAND